MSGETVSVVGDDTDNWLTSSCVMTTETLRDVIGWATSTNKISTGGKCSELRLE